MAENFVFKAINDPAVLEESFRLRYQVYCKECNFIRQEDYPDGIETDNFDAHSLHFGAFDPDGRLIGAARLVFSSCGKFPIEEHCPDLDVDWGGVLRNECVEVSRLTISKLYRRRAKDGLYYDAQASDIRVEDRGQHFLRRVRPMAFGLYRAMYQESKRAGIKYWFALMERPLWLLLKIHGFVFKPIGPEVDFYGMVTPYMADIREIEKSVCDKFPQFFSYFMENLEPEFQPRF